MNICDNIRYVGVNDDSVQLFEGLYQVPNGMAYNSYLIEDKKSAVMDSVDAQFVDEWLNKIRCCLGGKSPDYLVVLHMEPDHSAGILKFMQQYPTAKIVSSKKAFVIIGQLFNQQFEQRRILLDEGDVLTLGKSQLRFFSAPLVHWPEVMVAYESFSKTLFSADAFGTFGVNGKEEISPEDWLKEARRYYFGIVGKFGKQVQTLLNKLSGIEIERICSLHGPILDKNLSFYTEKYKTWSQYEAEEKGVFIAYTSIYGNTEKAAIRLYELLKKENVTNVVIQNLIGKDLSNAVAQAFRFDKLVLATTTYNGGVFPVMETFIRYLTERNFQNRKVGIIENGSWAPMSSRGVKAAFENSKDIFFFETTVTVRSALNAESERQLKQLANDLCR